MGYSSNRTPLWCRALVLVLLAPAAACRPSATPAGASAGVANPNTSESTASLAFTTVTGQSGVDFTYRNGREVGECAIVESLGGGIGSFDYDLDGSIDLCFAGGGGYGPDKKSFIGLPVGIFRQIGAGTFEDVADLAKLQAEFRYNHGVVAGDFNRDGFTDFVITGYGGVHLWKNLGDGTFVECHEEAALEDPSWSSSGAWGDFNGDGVSDIYLAHYVNWTFDNHPVCPASVPGKRDICPPRDFSPLPDSIFYGNGDGTFRDATREAGLKTDGKGLGVLVADFDMDGDSDIYVANDTTENFLYLNDGSGHFEESGLLRGVAVDDAGTPNGSMGVDVCDFNLDLRPDIWVTNYEREAFALYRNEGSGQFLHVSQPTGITALGGLFVGFGTACGDFDRDGDEDFLVANGHVILYPQASPVRQLPLLLEQRKQRFLRATQLVDAYFTTPHEGRGLSLADFDNDGDLDFSVSHLNDPVELVRNDVATGNWFGVQLVGTVSDRMAIGARLVLHTSDGKYLRHVRGGGSYLSTHDSRVFWGMGSTTRIERLEIFWPSGRSTSISDPPVNQYLTIVEPTTE